MNFSNENVFIVVEDYVDEILYLGMCIYMLNVLLQFSITYCNWIQAKEKKGGVEI